MFHLAEVGDELINLDQSIGNNGAVRQCVLGCVLYFRE